MNVARERERRRVLQVLWLCLAVSTGPVLSAGEDGSVSQPAVRSKPQPSVAERSVQALLLVRGWDSKSGELTAWMPMHSVLITLQALGDEGKKLSFKLNDAVTIRLPYRRDSGVMNGEMRITAQAVTFQGRQWVPVENDANIVYTHESPFYVKAIVFGEPERRPPVAHFSSRTRSD